VNLSQEGWLTAVGLSASEVPALLILEGTWWHKQRYELRLAHLEDVRELHFPDMYWGTHGGKAVVFCCAYGAPRAVEPVHVFGSLGTPAVIQIGSCGGLQPHLSTGDIMLPERAVIGEGASQYYDKFEVSEASLALVDAAQRRFKKCGFAVHRGIHLTTSALFAQSPERIRAWNNAGYNAVDMETSAVFSAAAHFGMKASSYLFVWDELLRGRTWLDPFTTEEQAAQRRANEAIFGVALEML
jgi:uridine phosphorylase